MSSRSHRYKGIPLAAAAAVVGVVVATTLVAGTYVMEVSGPAVVRLDGVALDITYLNGSPPIFGPTAQNACNETNPLGPYGNWPASPPSCPSYLNGGTPYDFQFFTTGNPGTAPGIWTNVTVTAPFDFQVNPEVYGWIPTTFSNTTGLFSGGGHFLYRAGQWTGWSLVFAFPETFSSPSGGLWLHATLAVQPTDQRQV